MNIYRPTRLEIDTRALAENARTLRRRLPASARLCAVVKADGYGHGAERAAAIALRNGAEQLAVAIPEEGARLREAGIGAPILVLGGIAAPGAEAAARYELMQTVFDAATVRALDAAARRYGKTLGVHIKIDTGMGRVGVRGAAELAQLLDALDAAENLKVRGVYTHFAAADDPDLAYTRGQAAQFEALAKRALARHPGAIPHAANSAALLRCPEYAYGMARAGIALYIDPDLPGGAGGGLRDAMRWTTRAVHVKTIEAGESVGYGRQFTAARATRVMTLPVGYADGYPRALGGKGCALVRGRRAPVIGRVCMDQAMLDVTEIEGAAVGDEAVLLGAQGKERIAAREFGRWCGLIEYEVLLSPTDRVPKVYV